MVNEALTNAWHDVLAGYFIVAYFIFLDILSLFIVRNKPEEMEKLPDDIKDGIDNIYITADMLGWKPLIFAIVIGVMWLPLALGWRLF